MSECIFCKIIAGQIPSFKIYEDDKVLAFLDINPVNPGHTLVVPKNHAADLIDASEEDVIELIRAVKKLAPAIIKGAGAEGFNLGVNNGGVAGQVVNHLHFHIMPRFSGDGHKLWSGKPYGENEAQQILEKIKKEL